MRVIILALISSLMLASPAISGTLGRDSELDFSTIKTMQESVAAVTSDMSPDEKKAFGKALFAILMERNPVTSALEPGLPQLMAMGQLSDNFYAGMDVWMSGVTVDEVKAKATAIAHEENRFTNTDAEKQKKAEALEAHQKCLNDRILVSNIHVGKDEYSAIMKFDVTNNLLFAISGVEFEYVVKQEGRSVPISKDKSSFAISGGVEPGETRTLSYYYSGPMGEVGKMFVETRIINAFDEVEIPLLDTNTTYLGRPEGFSDRTCE